MGLLIFSERLKILREEAKLSQRKLAERLYVSPSMIAMYELGYRAPSYETLLRIARLFHVSTDYLLGVERAEQTVDVSGLTPEQCQTVEQIIEISKSDKKMEAGKIKFILLESIGHAYINPELTDEQIKAGANAVLAV